MTKTALITGFEPFLNFGINPSGEIAKSLDGKVFGDVKFVGRTIPVSYDETGPALVALIKEVSPDLIVGTGLAAGRSKMSLEKIAVNYKSSTEPDNKGKTASGDPIDSEMPDGIFSGLSVEVLKDMLNKNGIPTEISMSAGAYLCNNAMFVIIRESKKLGIKGGFVHVPCDTTLAASIPGKSFPSLSLDTMVEAIKQIAVFQLSI